MHSEALFNGTPQANLNLHGLSGDGALLLAHQNQMSSTTDLSSYSNKLLDIPGVGVVGPPQYTSVIVEPPQNYQMDEYVH